MATRTTRRRGVAAPSLNDLLATIASVQAGKPDTVPAGWYTVEQVARERGVLRAQAGALIREAVAAGVVERKSFRIVTARGVYPVPHFRRLG